MVDSDGGRPRVLLKTSPDFGRLVGVDVGETRVIVELFDMSLVRLAKADLPLGDGGHDVEGVVERICTGLRTVIADAGIDSGEIIGVGVGVPGVVEHASEAVVHAQTIGWDAVPLEQLLREDTPSPLFIENGATALGQAEMWFGAGRGCRDAVVVLVGSGVGACVVTGGIPYQGATGGAGEWGHTTVQVGGARCRCGSLGCLEAYVGAGAVVERYAAAGGLPADAADEESVLGRLLADFSPTSRVVLDETATYLGVGIADLVNLFNPEKIIIGGWAGLMLGGRMLDRVRAVASEYALRRPYARTSIELCHLGPEAVAVGAATLPLAQLLDSGGIPQAARDTGSSSAQA
jgi:predicted NBD/HSP70 family sugar kinase